MKRKATFTTHTVISKDGTSIMYRRCGAGPGILILPGALTMAKDFDDFAAQLGRDFTVYTINRRGRGGSGAQGNDYSIEKELDDIDAVQQAAKAQYVFGHSFGGFLALEYARNRNHIKHVIVYEPGVSVQGSIPMDWAISATNHLDQGKPLDAFVEFVRAMNPDSARAPRSVLKAMLPIFIRKAERLQKYALLPGTIKEHAEEARLDNTYPNYHQISAKVLLMKGGKQGATLPAHVVMEREFPTWQTQTFAKLDHFGPEKASQTVADAVRQFAVKR